MSVYQNPEKDRLVAIDQCHGYLTSALIASRKPQNILELGFGSGASCREILNALNFNGLHFNFTVVDNWMDFNGIPPDELKKEIYSNVKFISSPEKDYVFSCKEKFDFIFSDADHFNTQNWFDYVYNELLNPEGILIYHDVTNSQQFPNLMRIYSDSIRKNYHHMLFNYTSRSDERCERGLLVIFKH